MIYSNAEFLFLLIPTLILFYLFRGSYVARFALLVAASLLFYSWTSVFDCIVFFFVVAVSWGALWAAHRSPMQKRLWLTIGISAMALHLFFWKYASWVTSVLYDLFPSAMAGYVLDLPLPVGISFFTLQGIAYLIDFGRGQAGFMSFRKYLLFKSFFPQLVAGPIVRTAQLEPQLETLNPADDRMIRDGLALFVFGMAKKLLIADRMSMLVDPIFASPSVYDRTSLIFAALGYTVQIWADFSGYTDMGRGVAKLLGVNLPENFLSPYLAKSPSEFWRRWHITLSTWIRDYIYIPLGGSQGSLPRVLCVAILTMIISGLWHGAAFTFVIWGAYHGLLLVFERLGRKLPFDVPAPMQWALMTVLTILGWIVFRVQSTAHLTDFFASFAQGAGATRADIVTSVALGCAACMAYQLITYVDLKPGSKPWIERFADERLMQLDVGARVSWPAAWACSAVLAAVFILTLFFRTSSDSPQFIYFKF